MAIAGASVPAYTCQVRDGELIVSNRSTAQNHLCVEVTAAVDTLSRGQSVLVRGSDMYTLRVKLQAHGVKVV